MKTPNELVVGNPKQPDAIGHIPSDLSDLERVQLIEAVRKHAQVVMLPLGEFRISRERDCIGKKLATVVARGGELASAVPWLEDYYRDRLQRVVSSRMGRLAVPLDCLDEAIIGNVLGFDMRFETHVDGWPLNANEYLQDICSEDMSFLALGTPDAGTYSEVLESPGAKIARVARTLNIVAAQSIPHTIKIVGRRPNMAFSGAGPDRGEYFAYMQHLREQAVFEAPDISSECFWDTASIALNFGYSTPQFDEKILGGQVGSAGVSARVYDKKAG